MLLEATKDGRPRPIFERTDRLVREELGAIAGGALLASRTRRVRDVLDVWVKQPLDERWVAAFRLVRSGGRLRVGEARVFPAEAQGPGPLRPLSAGDWSASWRGLDADAPRRGLTKGILARAQPHRWLGFTERVLGGVFRKMFPREFAAAAHTTPRPPLAARRGRRAHPDVFLARVAQQYARAAAAGRPPVKAVADAHGEYVAKVRGWIYQARRRGFLTPTAQGKTGGQLTARATFVLEAQKKEIPRRRLRRRSARRRGR